MTVDRAAVWDRVDELVEDGSRCADAGTIRFDLYRTFGPEGPAIVLRDLVRRVNEDAPPAHVTLWRRWLREHPEGGDSNGEAA